MRVFVAIFVGLFAQLEVPLEPTPTVQWAQPQLIFNAAQDTPAQFMEAIRQALDDNLSDADAQKVIAQIENTFAPTEEEKEKTMRKVKRFLIERGMKTEATLLGSKEATNVQR